MFIDEYADPVTYQIFNDHTHIIAIKPTGNVFTFGTVDRLNLKAKMLIDLIDSTEFKRSDIIHIQDPRNIANKNISDFLHVKKNEGNFDFDFKEKASSSKSKPLINSNSTTKKVFEEIAKNKKAIIIY